MLLGNAAFTFFSTVLVGFILMVLMGLVKPNCIMICFKMFLNVFKVYFVHFMLTIA